MQALASLLADGLVELQVEATSSQQQLLLDFLNLLKKWNRAYNLVADATDEVLLYRHLLDSIAIAPHLDANCVLDVGSGGGFPGIPLAILKPHCRFILLDSNGKKTRFLFQAKTNLNLSNVDVQNCRVEHYQSDSQIDIVTCRAFSSLKDTLDKTSSLLNDQSRFLAMKGQLPKEELDELGEDYQVAGIVKLQVPGGDKMDEAERHLIDIVPRSGYIG